MGKYVKRRHRRKARRDYNALSNEIARLRRHIHAAGDFERVPKRVLDRYEELMNEQDEAAIRAAYRRGRM